MTSSLTCLGQISTGIVFSSSFWVVWKGMMPPSARQIWTWVELISLSIPWAFGFGLGLVRVTGWIELVIRLFLNESGCDNIVIIALCVRWLGLNAVCDRLLNSGVFSGRENGVYTSNFERLYFLGCICELMAPYQLLLQLMPGHQHTPDRQWFNFLRRIYVGQIWGIYIYVWCVFVYMYGDVILYI